MSSKFAIAGSSIFAPRGQGRSDAMPNVGKKRQAFAVFICLKLSLLPIRGWSRSDYGMLALINKSGSGGVSARQLQRARPVTQAMNNASRAIISLARGADLSDVARPHRRVKIWGTGVCACRYHRGMRMSWRKKRRWRARRYRARALISSTKPQCLCETYRPYLEANNENAEEEDMAYRHFAWYGNGLSGYR